MSGALPRETTQCHGRQKWIFQRVLKNILARLERKTELSVLGYESL